jgi:predicted nuclease with TOPRIM domain
MIGIATEAVNQRAGFAHPIGVSPVRFCTAAGAPASNEAGFSDRTRRRDGGTCRALVRETMVDFASDGTMAEGNELTARVETVETKIDRLSQSVDERFNQVDKRFDQVDERFKQVDEAIAEQRAYTEFVYERLDGRISAVDGKVTALDGKVSALDGRVTALQGGFGRLERKLDHVIDQLDAR